MGCLRGHIRPLTMSPFACRLNLPLSCFKAHSSAEWARFLKTTRVHRVAVISSTARVRSPVRLRSGLAATGEWRRMTTGDPATRRGAGDPRKHTGEGCARPRRRRGDPAQQRQAAANSLTVEASKLSACGARATAWLLRRRRLLALSGDRHEPMAGQLLEVSGGQLCLPLCHPQHLLTAQPCSHMHRHHNLQTPTLNTHPVRVRHVPLPRHQPRYRHPLFLPTSAFLASGFLRVGVVGGHRRWVFHSGGSDGERSDGWAGSKMASDREAGQSNQVDCGCPESAPQSEVKNIARDAYGSVTRDGSRSQSFVEKVLMDQTAGNRRGTWAV